MLFQNGVDPRQREWSVPKPSLGELGCFKSIFAQFTKTIVKRARQLAFDQLSLGTPHPTGQPGIGEEVVRVDFRDPILRPERFSNGAALLPIFGRWIRSAVYWQNAY